MARKKRRKSAPRRKNKETPGWVWMLFGLAMGLTVAFAIFLHGRKPAPRVAVAAPRSASVVEDEREEPVAQRARPKPRTPEYDFYDMLPRFEVVVPEQDREVSREAPRVPLSQPGVYELQAGSFAQHADADRMRAQLALLGVESRIQRISIDEKTWHRVRIGPVGDLDRVNELRKQLREAKIDALTIRVGD